MTDAIVDTSVLIAAETGRRLRVDALPQRLGVSVITIGELRAGVLAAPNLAAREARLATLTALRLTPLAVDNDVVGAWAHLRVLLRDAGLRMEVNDSWIAATALRHGVPVVTQDDGYPELPGLSVIRI